MPHVRALRFRAPRCRSCVAIDADRCAFDGEQLLRGQKADAQPKDMASIAKQKEGWKLSTFHSLLERVELSYFVSI